MKKQTAVEWLHIEFQKRFTKETSEMYNNNQLAYEDMILKAKAMEKDQIMKTFDDCGNWEYECKGSEDYYNKTYEK